MSVHDSLARTVLFATGAAVVLPIMDGLIKSLVLIYPVVLIAWWRFAVMSALLVTVGARHRGWRQFRSHAPRWQALRAVLIVASAAGFYAGLRHLPQAECTAIMFVAPALAALFGFVFLNERPGCWGWAAIATSLLGALVVIRPGARMFDPAAVLVLFSAISYALFSLVTRVLARYDSPRVTTLWSALGALAAFTLALPAWWTPLQSPEHWAVMLGIGALGALGQYLFTLAYRHGRTHMVGPLTYLSLPMALIIGWMQFAHVPDRWSLIGMLLIGSAALMVWRGHAIRGEADLMR